MKISHLVLSWSVSRGRDTYGCNICRLDDRETGKRYRCNGGGYDMIGTVFGDWLADVHQDKLVDHVVNLAQTDCGYAVAGYKKVDGLCGLTINPNGTITLDGACGLKSMISIAEAIGLDVQREYQKTGRNRGATLGYYVCGKG